MNKLTARVFQVVIILVVMLTLSVTAVQALPKIKVLATEIKDFARS